MYFRQAEGGFVRELEDHCLNPECYKWCGGESACGLVSDAFEEALREGMVIDLLYCPHHRAVLGGDGGTDANRK